MWQKDLKIYKKTQPAEQNNKQDKVKSNKPKEQQDISFTEYCKQFAIKQIEQDTVILKPEPKSLNKTSYNLSKNYQTDDFNFIDSDQSSKEFYRHGQKNLPKELRSGKIIFTRTVDVHNLTKVHALDLIERLISDATPGDCIKIIHGVGLNSEYNQPVLLGTIRKYLTLSPRVLAYSYGSQQQGSNGVTLVKLAR